MKYTLMNRNINFHQVRNSVWFDGIIRFLKSKYTFITAADLEKSIAYGEPLKNTCHITFDDGDITFYNIVLPVLVRHEVPATLFVSPKICKKRVNFWFQDLLSFDLSRMKIEIAEFTGIPVYSLSKISTVSILKSLPIRHIKELLRLCSYKQNSPDLPFRNVNVQQLREITRTGQVIIGAHTLNHPILKNEDDVTSRYEICSSIEDLADLLDTEVRYFAYPNGINGLDFTQREKDYLRECGIRLAFENESAETIPKDNMSIPRIAVSDEESMNQIDLKLRFPGMWYSFKRLNPSGEYSERTRLQKMMQAAEIS